MTLMINLSPKTEERLQRRADKVGKPLQDLVTEIVEEAADVDEIPSTDIVDHLRKIGVLGAVKGKPRADGKPWSEVEAACDTH